MATPGEIIVNANAFPHHSPVIFARQAQWNGMKIEHTRMRRGEITEHWHAEHQIFIPLAGSFLPDAQSATGCQKGGHRTVGHTVIVPSGQPYSVSWEEELETLSIYLDPSLLVRAAAEWIALNQIELDAACDARDPLIRQIGLALLNEIGSEAPAGRLYVDSLANTLAVHLLRHYSTVGDKIQPVFGGLARHKLRRATEFIAENLESNLTLAEIAETVDLSPYHFARAFKQATGRTPHQYLMEKRIERAKQLLAKTELPIVEVALSVGFKNQSHFTTIFRKLTAMTPKAYRDAFLR